MLQIHLENPRDPLDPIVSPDEKETIKLSASIAAYASSSGNILGHLDSESFLTVESFYHPYPIFAALDTLYLSSSLLSKINSISTIMDCRQDSSTSSKLIRKSMSLFRVIQRESMFLV